MSKKKELSKKIITNQESKLIEAYMQTAVYYEAFDLSGMVLDEKDIQKIQIMAKENTNTEEAYTRKYAQLVHGKKGSVAFSILNKPEVKAELSRRLRDRRKADMATSDEVMYYFTLVMRGEIKDQFGLDAPLSERTRAAVELAKRTVDIEIEKEQNTMPNINIQLNWQR